VHVVTRRILAVLAVAAALAIALVVRGRRASEAAPEPTPQDVAIGDTVMIDGLAAPACATCSFDVGLAATIGSRTDAEIPQRVPHVLRDGRGNHYLVFHGWVNKPILRYDSAGKYLGTVGRYGQGPGEYTMTFEAFVGPGDSLYVWGDGRLQLFGPDGSYGRTVRTKGITPIGVGPGADGTIYARTNPRVQDGALVETEPLVVTLDSRGIVRDSFPVFFISSRVSWATPVVAPDGDVWTRFQGRGGYRLERHAPDGRVMKLLGVTTSPDSVHLIMTRRQADSVRALLAELIKVDPPGARPSPPPRPRDTKPPRPASRVHMVVDSTGLLWMARTIPAPGWDTLTITPVYAANSEAPGEATIPREQEDRRHHTIIEIIDPRTARFIARTQVPFLAQLARPGFVARVTADEDGAYRTEVHRVTLQRR
jgi:hypothetical protein